MSKSVKQQNLKNNYSVDSGWKDFEWKGREFRNSNKFYQQIPTGMILNADSLAKQAQWNLTTSKSPNQSLNKNNGKWQYKITNNILLSTVNKTVLLKPKVRVDIGICINKVNNTNTKVENFK